MRTIGDHDFSEGRGYDRTGKNSLTAVLKEIKSDLDALQAGDAPGTAIAGVEPSTPATLESITLLDGQMKGGKIQVLVTATDGTDVQSAMVEAKWAAVRKGATITFDVSQDAAPAVAVSAGTIHVALPATSISVSLRMVTSPICHCTSGPPSPARL